MEKPGLYVHVPFCKTRCPYCDFSSTTNLSWIPSWIDALLKEASLYRSLFPPFDTLYLGGGTPGLLGPRQMERLIRGLESTFSLAPDSERTIELNPEDVTLEGLHTLRGLGFDRVSLGVQSLDEAELHFLGRRHGVTDSLRSLGQIREAGFLNLSVDLMYGLPGRHPRAWARTLERIRDFYPQHLSCYQLTFKPGTPFFELQRQGELPPLPEDVEGEFYGLTCSILEEAGYTHYEVSSFSLGEAFRSRHNSKYWRHVPYLGLGPSAHSFDGRSRWWNVRPVEAYCSRLSKGLAPIEDREFLTEEQLKMETLLLGFRMRDGFPLRVLANCESAASILRVLEASGLVTLCGDAVLPTDSGFLVADSLPLLFLQE
ncbi:MAG: radical SAM family heme chaperone HemW [Thermodesulfobacteriota bacterium]